MSAGDPGIVAVTVIGLFDDEIDAEHALSALKKSSRSAADVSVLVRDRRAGGEGGGPLDVTQAIMNTAASTVGSWLQGLAALVVPNQGRMVVAGPIGAILGRSEQSLAAAAEVESREQVEQVGFVFERFGFRADEAHYLEQRLEAGSALIAVTTGDEQQLESTRRLFADHNAVYIGQAQTALEVVGEAEGLIANPVILETDGVIVTDVVAPFRKLCGDEKTAPWCGVDVVDERGDAAGEVDELIADPDDAEAIRYVVVGHGGLLGIARKRVAVPVEIVDFDEARVRVRMSREYLHRGPVYDPDTPFSRNDELATCAFFATSLPGGAA